MKSASLMACKEIIKMVLWDGRDVMILFLSITIHRLSCWRRRGRPRVDLSTLTPPPDKKDEDVNISRWKSLLKKLLIVSLMTDHMT